MNNMDNVISELIKATEAQKAWKREVERLKKLVFAHAGESDTFETDGFIVKIEKSPSICLNTELLYADFPDIKETYGKVRISKSIVPIAKEATKTA